MMPPIQIAIRAAASRSSCDRTVANAAATATRREDADRVAADDAEAILTGDVATEQQSLQREADDHRDPPRADRARPERCEQGDEREERHQARGDGVVAVESTISVDGGGQAPAVARGTRARP